MKEFYFQNLLKYVSSENSLYQIGLEGSLFFEICNFFGEFDVKILFSRNYIFQLMKIMFILFEHIYSNGKVLGQVAFQNSIIFPNDNWSTKV